jgi:hypothetical protein
MREHSRYLVFVRMWLTELIADFLRIKTMFHHQVENNTASKCMSNCKTMQHQISFVPKYSGLDVLY